MIILASQSAIRARLLRDAGLQFETAAPGVDEDAVKASMNGASPRKVAEALAARKALAVAGGRAGWVIGADSTLEFEGRLYDKARTIDEARLRLKAWRGKTHSLHSAVALAQGDKVVWRECLSPRLTMRDFSDAWLDDYLSRNGPEILSSVGCYQFEHEGVQMFTAVEGDYFAVLGLPLLGLLECLRAQGELAR